MNKIASSGVGGLGVPGVGIPSRSRHRRRRRRRKNIYLLLFLLLAIFLPASYTASVALPPLPGGWVVLNAQPPTGSKPHDFSLVPSIEHYALEVDGYPSAGLESNSDKTVPIASISKVVLALMLIEEYMPTAKSGSSERGPEITYTEEDVEILRYVIADEGSWAGVHAGLKLSLYDSLVALMLPSANNYALSLARWSWGSDDGYAQAAKAWLEKNQLNKTQILEASGADERNVSTGKDLLRLSRLAYENPILREIVAMPTADLPGVGKVKNTNKALGAEGVDGTKTGSSPEAGSNLLFTAEKVVEGRPIRIYAAITGEENSSSLYDKVSQLVQVAYSRFRSEQLASKGEIFGEYRTHWGEKIPVILGEDLRVTLTSTSKIRATVKPVSYQGTESLGKIEFTVDKQVYEVPLMLTRLPSKPDIGWRLANPFKLWLENKQEETSVELQNINQ